MFNVRLKLAAAAILAVPLAGCAYDMYGDPYGYGYGYPRSSVSFGIGYGGGYGGYGYGGYGYGYPYGSYYGGYGYDPFGWYGNYYYPGTGIYVYDRHRTRHVWSDEQRRYWEQRRHRSGTGGVTTTGSNWSGWDRAGWSGRHGTTTTTSVGSVPTTRWNRGSEYRGGGWRSRSSATTSQERPRGWSGDRPSRGHSRESSDERPD